MSQVIPKALPDWKPGDRIHIEYKPLIGTLRVYDTEFLDLLINISSRYFSIYETADDYSSLMEKISDELFDNMQLCFLKKLTASLHGPEDSIW